jgi:hypothetical protein
MPPYQELRDLAERSGFRLTHVKIYGAYRYYVWSDDGQLSADGQSFDERELAAYLDQQRERTT